MRRVLLALLPLALASPASAYTVKLKIQANSSSDWTAPAVGPTTAEAPSGASFSTSGKCDTATTFDAATDYAVIESRGTMALADGDRLGAWTLQFWYRSAGSPGAFCRFFSMEHSYAPTFRRYDTTGLRWDDVSSCQWLSGVPNLFDGAWHKIRLTAENMNNASNSNRKVYIDDTLVGSCTDSIFGWGGFLLTEADDLIFGNTADTLDNGCTGDYDEIQLVDTYDATLKPYCTGNGCIVGETDVGPTATVLVNGDYSASVQLGNGTTCPIECETLKWEARASNSATAPLIDSSSFAYDGDTVPVYYPHSRMDGATPYIRTACDAWRPIQEDCSPTSAWGSWSALTPARPANASTATTQWGRVAGGDKFARPNTPANSNALDSAHNAWATCWDNNGGGSYLSVNNGAAYLSGTPGAGCRSVPLPHRDQFVVAFIDNTGTGAGQDITLQLRSSVAGTFTTAYQCKFESTNTVKWNKQQDTDGDGTLDAGEYGTACGSQTVTLNWPGWVRCEAYDNPANANQVLLKIYTAPDSTGVPGAWTLRTTVTDQTVGGTGTCNAGNWAGTGPPIRTDSSGIGISILKTNAQRFYEVAWGVLESDPASRGVHPSRRRTP